MEFDWWERGRDFIADMWGGKASLRRIWVIITNLPPTSALLRRLAREEPEQWTAGEYILANIFDVLNVANWQRGHDPKRPKPPPKPHPRPGEEQARRERYEALGRAEMERRRAAGR